MEISGIRGEKCTRTERGMLPDCTKEGTNASLEGWGGLDLYRPSDRSPGWPFARKVSESNKVLTPT